MRLEKNVATEFERLSSNRKKRTHGSSSEFIDATNMVKEIEVGSNQILQHSSSSTVKSNIFHLSKT